MASDRMTRAEAGEVLALKYEGVRKLEKVGRLSGTLDGRTVTFDRSAVLALKAERETRKASRVTRTAETYAERTARARAEVLREGRAIEAKQAREQAARDRETARESTAWYDAQNEAEAKRRANDEALRALSSDFELRTFSASAAAEVLGTTSREVSALERRGVLPPAVRPPAMLASMAAAGEAPWGLETRYDREEVRKVRDDMRARVAASAPAAQLAQLTSAETPWSVAAELSGRFFSALARGESQECAWRRIWAELGLGA